MEGQAKAPDPTPVAEASPSSSSSLELSQVLAQARLPTASDDALFLLGRQRTEVNSYYARIGDVSPPAAPAYETLVIQVEQGSARLAGVLPYLAIPTRRGFVYFGNASVNIDETLREDSTTAPLDAEQAPHWYFATQLWRTTERSQIDAVRSRLQQSLLRQKAWGKSQERSIVYATPRVVCVRDSSGDWVGGAHYISGFEEQQLVWLEQPASELLSDYVDAKRFANAAAALLRTYTADFDESDRPALELQGVQHLFWDSLEWKQQTKLCLERQSGQVMAMAWVSLHTMSARSAIWSVPVAPAAEVFGFANQPALPLSDLQRAIPTATDAFVGPQGTVVVQTEQALTVYMPSDTQRGFAAGVRVALEHPHQALRVVSTDWAVGRHVNRWLQLLGLTNTQH